MPDSPGVRRDPSRPVSTNWPLRGTRCCLVISAPGTRTTRTKVQFGKTCSPRAHLRRMSPRQNVTKDEDTRQRESSLEAQDMKMGRANDAFVIFQMLLVVGLLYSVSAASAYRQDNYFGEHGTMDDTREKRLSPVKHLNMDNRQVNPAGLTGVWAEENTRESIWAAIWRKETYATSGLRMKVRLFGGWEYDPGVLKYKDWV